MTTQYDPYTRIQYKQEPCEYIDEETGEVRRGFVVRRKVYGQRRFIRLQADVLLKMLSGGDGKCWEIAIWIASNSNYKNNIYYGTYSQIRDYLDVSTNTVTRIMSELQQRDVIRKVANGQWMFNPYVGVACHEEERGTLINAYMALNKKPDKRKGDDDDGRDNTRRSGKPASATTAGAGDDIHSSTGKPEDEDFLCDVYQDAEGFKAEQDDDIEMDATF